MNYRHAYHAGNFADVLKHAVLSLVIEHLKRKPAPFRVIDTHAGIGLYDLASPEAEKTGEWRDGIGRLLAPGALPADAGQLLRPYLDVIRSINPSGDVTRYPGSPLLARRLMRSGDTVIANEMHPDDVVLLRRVLASEPDSKVLSLDGYVALRSLLPPKERRGLVLIDPPFEVPDELERLAGAVQDFVKRFATGTLLVWYPIKDPRQSRQLQRTLLKLGLPKLMAVELLIRAPKRIDRLNGCGLLVLNGPFTLPEQLERLLPVLARLLAQDDGAIGHVEHLTDAP